MVSVGTEASSGQNEKDTILLLDRSQMAEYTQFCLVLVPPFQLVRDWLLVQVQMVPRLLPVPYLEQA